MKTVVLLLLSAVSCQAQTPPTVTVSNVKLRSDEVRASQLAPACSVHDKEAGKWLTYPCGQSNIRARYLEARNTVYVYAGAERYKTIVPTANKQWWLTNILNLGLAVADEEVTQYDIRNHVAGHEGNIFLGKSRGQAYAVIGGTEVLRIAATLHRKSAVQMNRELGIAPSVHFWNQIPWWTPSVIDAGIHAVGIVSGLRR